MKRLTFAVCLLSALASAPAFAADCAGMASTSTGSTTTTTASTSSDHKGG